MPGTLVHDAAIPSLLSGTLTANSNGSAVQVGRAAMVRARLQCTGTVSGTTPTLSVEIQSSDDSTFSSGVIHHGTFNTVTASLGAGVNRFLPVDDQKTYVRAVATVAGTTPSFAGVTVSLEERRYLRSVGDTA